MMGCAGRGNKDSIVGPEPPAIRIAPDTLSAFMDDPAQFRIVPQGNDAVKLMYVWNFHDGSVPVITYDDTISHTFSMSGTYTVVCNAYVDGQVSVAAKDSSVAVITDPGDITSFKAVLIYLKIPAITHYRISTYDYRIHGFVYVDVDSFEYREFKIHKDTIAGLSWNGPEFSYMYEYPYYPPKLIVSLNGKLASDFKSIDDLSISYLYQNGGMYLFGYNWSYRLTGIPIDPPSRSNERFCNQSGMALDGHISNVTWSDFCKEAMGHDDKSTLTSWSVDDKASLVIKFIR
jgi:hypothetical protein